LETLAVSNNAGLLQPKSAIKLRKSRKSGKVRKEVGM
jgi:hypothetical protein